MVIVVAVFMVIGIGSLDDSRKGLVEGETILGSE